MIFISLLLIMTNNSNAQGRHRFQDKGRGMERMAELEQVKLLETLDLDEETSVKFFVRRKKHKELQREISLKRQEALEKLAEAVKSDAGDNSQYEASIKEILTYEEKLLDNREKFLESLNDIMDKEKIAKLVVFEYLFKQEIQNELRNRWRRNK